MVVWEWLVRDGALVIEGIRTNRPLALPSEPPEGRRAIVFEASLLITEPTCEPPDCRRVMTEDCSCNFFASSWSAAFRSSSCFAQKMDVV